MRLGMFMMPLHPALAKRSTALMATEVMPRVNAAIGAKGKTSALTS